MSYSDTIFLGNDPEEAAEDNAVETAASEEQPQESAPPADDEEETGASEAAADTSSEDDDASPAPSRKPPRGFVDQKALFEERQKRQELAEKLARLEGKLSVLHKDGDDEDSPGVDEADEFWQNPHGYVKKLGDTIRQEVKAEFQTRHIARCERKARKNHDDYDKVINEFKELPNAAAIFSSMQSDDGFQEDPAEYLYGFMQSRKPDGRVAELERELADLKKQLGQGGDDARPAAIPNSNAGGRNVGGKSKKAQDGYEDVFESRY